MEIFFFPWRPLITFGWDNVISPLLVCELFSFYCVALVMFAWCLCRLWRGWNLWRCVYLESCIRLSTACVASCALKTHMRRLLIIVPHFDYKGIGKNSKNAVQTCFYKNYVFTHSEYFFTSLKTNPPLFKTTECSFSFFQSHVSLWL